MCIRFNSFFNICKNRKKIKKIKNLNNLNHLNNITKYNCNINIEKYPCILNNNYKKKIYKYKEPPNFLTFNWFNCCYYKHLYRIK